MSVARKFDYSGIQLLLNVVEVPITKLKFKLEDYRGEDLDIVFDEHEKDSSNVRQKLFEEIYHDAEKLLTKLFIIRHFWNNGTVAIENDRDIFTIGVGINFEIHDLTLKVFRLGCVTLPYLKQNNNVVREFSNVLQSYVYKSTFVNPARFNAKSKDVFKTEMNPDELMAFKETREIPAIRYNKDTVSHFALGTTINPDSLKKFFDQIGLEDKLGVMELHPHHKDIDRVIGGLRYLLDALQPNELIYNDEITIQRTVLEYLYVLHSWSEGLVVGLLKDDQVLKRAYKDNLRNKTTDLSYRLWKETEINNMLNPTIHLTSNIC